MPWSRPTRLSTCWRSPRSARSTRPVKAALCIRRRSGRRPRPRRGAASAPSCGDRRGARAPGPLLFRAEGGLCNKFTVLLWRPRRVPVRHEVLVERVQRFHIGRAQGRVAELRVLLDACGRHGLWDHNTASLEAPPHHDLGGRQATPSRDVEQAWFPELLGPRERRVGLHENTLGRAELAKRRACDEGVAFYL